MLDQIMFAYQTKYTILEKIIRYQKYMLFSFVIKYRLQNPAPKENKQLLKKSVEEEYRKWTSMANDNDIISHFSVPGTPLFLCLLWKMIFETNRISPIAFK